VKIVGVLSWFDESPSWLATAVAGFARVCDQIVAVDGAYALYPGGRARSRPDQAEAILGAAEAAGAGCVIHRPRDVWFGNEVEKRNHSLFLAAALSPDWVMVFDADYHVLQLDAEAVRRELAATDCNVGTYTILDGKDLQEDEYIAKYARERYADTEWTTKTRDIYRWTDDLAYGPKHFTISGTYDGERRWIRGPEFCLSEDQWSPVEPCVDMLANLVVNHRNQHRPLARRKAAGGYSELRNEAGVEAWPTSMVAA
jgi:hypothetical protein